MKTQEVVSPLLMSCENSLMDLQSARSRGLTRMFGFPEFSVISALAFSALTTSLQARMILPPATSHSDTYSFNLANGLINLLIDSVVFTYSCIKWIVVKEFSMLAIEIGMVYPLLVH